VWSLVIIFGCFEMKTAQAHTIDQNQIREATKMIPNINVISGTIGDDILVGTPQTDVIDGDAGRDILLGNSSGDALGGGTGSDFIYGGAGGDVLDGDDGRDICLAVMAMTL
jgi:Ca2+-binding RTX toxin-like protein